MKTIEHKSKYGVTITDANPIPTEVEWAIRELLTKKCTICQEVFTTYRNNKNICSWVCRQEHNRRNARKYARSTRNGKKIYDPCIVCGFSGTTDQHHEGGEVYTLCPNHHCMITRNIVTLRDLLLTIP